MDCQEYLKDASKVTSKSRLKSSKSSGQICKIIAILAILAQIAKALPQPPAELFKLKQNKILNPGGRRGLEVERSHGVQAARVRISPTLLFFVEINRDLFLSIAESGSVVKRKEVGEA